MNNSVRVHCNRGAVGSHGVIPRDVIGIRFDSVGVPISEIDALACAVQRFFFTVWDDNGADNRKTIYEVHCIRNVNCEKATFI